MGITSHSWGSRSIWCRCSRLETYSFKEAWAGLSKALASVAFYLCTTLLEDPAVLMPFVACRLIPLNKCPGVHPIGIGDVP